MASRIASTNSSPFEEQGGLGAGTRPGRNCGPRGARLYRPSRLGRLPPREAGAADVDGRQALDRRDDGPRRGVYSAEVASVRRVPAFPAGMAVLTEQLPT